MGVSVQGFMSRGSLSRIVSVQGGLCPGVLCPRGICPGGLCQVDLNTFMCLALRILLECILDVKTFLVVYNRSFCISRCFKSGAQRDRCLLVISDRE